MSQAFSQVSLTDPSWSQATGGEPRRAGNPQGWLEASKLKRTLEGERDYNQAMFAPILGQSEPDGWALG